MKCTKFLALALSLSCTVAMLAGCSGSSQKVSQNGTPDVTSAQDQKCTITYAIWDKNQQPGMQAIADKFHEAHPNISVKVEVTDWENYWIKLEAAANGGALPDVFWMHSNNFIKYAKGNMLMDLTQKIASSTQTKNDNFPKGLVELYTLDSKQYAIPKDYDTIGLWYNKTLFDAKGIKYPDATWDWAKLKEVAKKLTDSANGIYGVLSPVDSQAITYDLMYQNGSYPISDDRTKSGYDTAESIEAVKFAVDLSLTDKVSPTQDQFANTTAIQYFESGKGAMGFFGSWMTSEFYANEYTKANCNVTVLPKGKKQASIYNGLGNAVAANTKYADAAWKFVDYLGSKEANQIQSDNGSAIPAYNGLTEGWVAHFKGFNANVFPEMLDYAVLNPNNWNGMAAFVQQETDGLTAIYGGKVSVQDGCKALAKQMNENIASAK